MPRYEYDAEASERLQTDVVHEVHTNPAAVPRWVDAMRRLNAIDDQLERRILALHRDCGTGEGECDPGMDRVPITRSATWGCETTAAIADHFGVQYTLGREN